YGEHEQGGEGPRRRRLRAEPPPRPPALRRGHEAASRRSPCTPCHEEYNDSSTLRAVRSHQIEPLPTGRGWHGQLISLRALLSSLSVVFRNRSPCPPTGCTLAAAVSGIYIL